MSLRSAANLELNDNDLDSTLPVSLFFMSELKILSIEANERMHGTISPFISQLEELQRLKLGSTNLGGTLPKELFSLTDLSELNLKRASFSGSIPEEIRLLNASLMDLYLNDNAFTGSVPEAFDYLTALGTWYCGCCLPCALLRLG